MKIAVLLSGGVDSSVALHLLKEQGHELTAFYLKIWLEDELSYMGSCPWEEDLRYVKAVCEQFDVPLEVVSLQKEYHEKIVTYTINEIKKGRTPNPDMLCNTHIKFGFFFDHIDDSFDKIATGHYAQLKKGDGVVYLVRSPDPIKDQTYFLSYLTQEQLSRALFPIGHMKKEAVRALAEQYRLPTSSRKDSQGICFLGKLRFNDFVKHYLRECPGDLIEWETGKKLGKHKGFWYHTIGQRQGSGLAGGPWYVVTKDTDKNCVYVSRNYYANDKRRDTFEVASCNWIAGKPNKEALKVKMRHGKQLHDCIVTLLPNDRAHVHLMADDQGIAPGQFAVFYDDQVCCGAGIITKSL